MGFTNIGLRKALGSAFDGIKIIKNDMLYKSETIKIKRTWRMRLFTRPLFKKYLYRIEEVPYGIFIDKYTFVCHSEIYNSIKYCVDLLQTDQVKFEWEDF